MAELQLAAAVVVYRDSVLIVRRSKTEGFKPLIWGVPCGKVDKGEDASRAVLRELTEETGLHGEVVDEIGTSEFVSCWHGLETKNFQKNYLVRLKSTPADTDADEMPRVMLPKKDQRARWVRLTEILDVKGVDDYNRDIIRQGIDWIDGKDYFPGTVRSDAAMASFQP